MARIHNPVDPEKRKKRGMDNQLHGGTLEETDQVSNAIANAVGNIGDNDQSSQDKQ